MMDIKLTTSTGEVIYRKLSEEKQTWSVGRDSQCDVVIPGICIQVSRRHLQLSLVEGIYYVEDRSKLGTFLQGERLRSGEQVAFQGSLVLGDKGKDGACTMELTEGKGNETTGELHSEVAVIEPVKPAQSPLNQFGASREASGESVSAPAPEDIQDIVRQVMQDTIYGKLKTEKTDGDEEENALESMKALQEIQESILDSMQIGGGDEAKEGGEASEADRILKEKLLRLSKEYRHKFDINGALENYLERHREEVLEVYSREPVKALNLAAVKSALLANIEEQFPEAICKCVMDNIRGYGPITPLIEDESIDEIMVNGPNRIFIEKNGLLKLTGLRFLDEASLMAVIQKIAAQVNRHIDEASPMVMARLKNGSRVNAVIRPLSFEGAALTIRKFSKRGFTLDELIEKGTLTKDMAEFLKTAVRARQNIIVSGGTGSGKTTLLNALCHFIPDTERLVIIEDLAELKINHVDRVRLEARPANIEGQGLVTIRDLLVNSLRMRPDRIIIGECRAGEAFDMLQAMNTGHDGSLTTIHANNPRDTLSRLENMVLMAGFELPVSAIQKQIGSAINLIVQTSRLPDGSRKITDITEIAGYQGNGVSWQQIFEFEQRGMAEGHVKGNFVAKGILPKFIAELRQRGQLGLNTDMFKKTSEEEGAEA